MEKLVLVTRPIEQARQFAAEISALGAKAFIEPLLMVVPDPIDWQKVSRPEAILLTSPQPLKSQDFPDSFRSIPVFCVGEKTRHIAEEAGALHAVSGSGGVEEVYPLLRSQIPVGSKVLYLRGDIVSHDVAKALFDYQVQEIICYHSIAANEFSSELIELFPYIHSITLFSPRTGHILKELMLRNGLIEMASNINLLCLSTSVLDSASGIKWKSAQVADAPSQEAMIRKLKTLI